MTPAKQPKDQAWHSQSAEEVLAQLDSPEVGPSPSEATQRLAADARLLEAASLKCIEATLTRFMGHSAESWHYCCGFIFPGAFSSSAPACVLLRPKHSIPGIKP